jgi:hypothetical protein
MNKMGQEKVSLETEVTQGTGALRAAEASGERYKTRYEELLESSAIERCELEEARKELKELKARAKVVAEEEEGKEEGKEEEGKEEEAKEEEAKEEPQGEESELLKAKKEAAFVRQLLKELVSAISKGAVSIPSAEKILNKSTV